MKPIKFKIDDIEPTGRFLNLFDKFSPLCAVAHQQQLKSALSSTSRVESVIELPAGLHGDIPALKAQPSQLAGPADALCVELGFYADIS